MENLSRVVLVFSILLSLSAQASCLLGYADRNVERKMLNGFITLGGNVLASKISPSGVEKALELLTESFALRSDEPSYLLKVIRHNYYGNNLIKILIENRTHRLEKMQQSLEKEGVFLSISEIADAVLYLDEAHDFCKEFMGVSSFETFQKFKTYKQIKSMLKVHFMSSRKGNNV